jgi:hypothetical protein
MKRYAFDTSGISNPLESMPEDVHESVWSHFKIEVLPSGIIAVTQEIYDEMEHIPGTVGGSIKANKSNILLEVGEDWDWGTYVDHCNKLEDDHRDVISEFIGGSKKTVGLTDISIIALAKTLKIPVVSMEKPVTSQSKKMHIPDICKIDKVDHLSFSEFCRKENMKF